LIGRHQRQSIVQDVIPRRGHAKSTAERPDGEVHIAGKSPVARVCM